MGGPWGVVNGAALLVWLFVAEEGDVFYSDSKTCLVGVDEMIPNELLAPSPDAWAFVLVHDCGVVAVFVAEAVGMFASQSSACADFVFWVHSAPYFDAL